jgi:phytoene dehydrogenase-like protein
MEEVALVGGGIGGLVAALYHEKYKRVASVDLQSVNQ